MKLFKNLSTNLKKNKLTIWLLGIIFSIYLGAFFIGHPLGCVFENFLGISCLGCGMFSAWYHFLHGDIQTAFYFHPLFWLVPIIFVLLFIDNFLLARNSKRIELSLILIGLVFIVVYVLRVSGILTGFAPLLFPFT